MSDWIEVRRSPIHGNGVFAKTEIPPGTLVAEYRGEIISEDELERRADLRSREEADGSATTYFFAIGDGFFIDAANVTEGNPARYINHSCEENCETRWNALTRKMEIFSLQTIRKGEEITFDYGFELAGFFEHPCRCGSRNCCGFIVAKILRPALLKKRARHARASGKA